MQRGFGSRSSLILFVLINIAWAGLVALWVYHSINNYQTIQRISTRFSFGPAGVGPPWVALFGAGILMLFLLLGIIVIYITYRKQAALNLVHQNFISSVTHELRSPLASLQLYLETLVLRDPEEGLRKTKSCMAYPCYPTKWQSEPPGTAAWQSKWELCQVMNYPNWGSISSWDLRWMCLNHRNPPWETNLEPGFLEGIHFG